MQQSLLTNSPALEFIIKAEQIRQQMMNLKETLRKLWKQGVEIYLKDGELRYNATPLTEPQSIVDVLEEHHQDIVEILQKEPDLYTGFPLSYGQHAMVLMQEIAPNSTAYNATAALQLKADLDIDTLQRSLDFQVQRHEALRTEFCRVDGELAQRVLSLQSIPIQMFDVQAYDDEAIEKWIDELADIPFDISRGVNFNVYLLDNKNPQNAHNRFILLILGHHATIDFIAVEILLSELVTIYYALVEGEEPKLLPTLISYKEYVIAEMQSLEGERGETLWNYWQPQLSTINSVLELPTDYPRPPMQSFRGAQHEFAIDALLYAAIKKLAMQLRATPFVVVMAAYQILVQRYSKENSIALGIPMGNRAQHRCHKVVGHFTNPIPLIADMSKNPTFAELVADNLEHLKGAMAHQDLPLPYMVNRLQLERDLSRPPLIQTGFSWNQTNSKRHNIGTGSLIEEIRRSEQRGAIYDLVMSGYDTSEKVVCTLRYNSDLFNLDTVEQIAKHFLQLLRSIIAAPEEPISKLVMLPNRELGELLNVDFSQLAAVAPLTATQQDLYLAHMLDPDTETNSLGITAELKTEIDANILKEELQHLVDGNNLLRAHIVPCDKRYCDIAYWVVHKEKPVNFIETDLSEQQLSDEAMLDYVNKRVYRPYDIYGELYHFELIKRGAADYVLLTVANHIVFDGVALNSGIQQCLSNYELRLKGEPVNDTEDNFSAYISKANEQFDSYDNRHYWKRKFANVEPLDIPVPVAKTGKQVFRHVVLDSQHLQLIKNYSGEHGQFGASTSTGGVARYFKTLYCLLINAYTRPSADFQIRDTWSARTRGDRLTIGCYHQMVPFVVPQELMSGGTRIDSLFEYAREHTQEVTDHSQISLLLQNQLAPSGQIGFMYNFYITAGDMPFADGNAKLHILAPLDVQGQVQLIIKQENEQLVMGLLYDDDLFPDLQFLERLIALSEQVLAGARQLSDLNALFADEREQLLSTSGNAWNATELKREPVGALHQLIEQQVERTPDAVAVSFADQSWSYQALNEHANQLAHYLRDHYSVGPDVMVGLCMERSLEMSLALLAVLKAGGAYVPFDPSFPQDRLGFMLEDTEVPVMLTQSHLQAHLPSDQPVKKLCLDTDATLWENQPTNNLDVGIQSDHLFNVIFTSGSTGKPKGVMVPHRGIINRLQWMQKAYPIDASDRILQKTPYSFDVSVWELFWPLMQGAQLVYARPEGHKDPDYLRDLMIERAITTLHFVPSMLGLFLQAAEVEQCRSVRRVFCSGEALQPEHVRRFFERFDHCELHNLYGPTEASVDVSYFACQRDADYRSVPIGKPVDNTQLLILDKNLQPVPVGIVGELYIGGVQLARGYLKREELTRNTFIDNPFQEQGHPSERLYKTGDLARYLPDGNIEYIGRVDFQVKVRGLRIELGEIETVLLQHEQIKEAIVITKDLGSDNVVIVAYLVPESADNKPADDSLRSHLRDHLPEYMVPNFFVMLDKMPLSANGKADRKALPDPKPGEGGAEYVAPRTELEQKIAAIWQEQLQISKVGIHDNFFESGGHSLLATQTVSRLQEVLDVEVGIRTLFDFPTISGLAQHLGDGDHAERLPPITVMERPEKLPLSLSQLRLWFVEQLNPGNIAYLIPGALRVFGPIDQQVLSHALETIIQRHESLRTRFIGSDGEAEQIIEETQSWSLPVTDLSDLSTEDQEVHIQEMGSKIVTTPYDFSEGHLYHFELLKLSDNEHVLLVSMHHVISDGWSAELLLSEVGQVWQAYEKGEPSPLPPLEIQYADYTLWQRDWLHGEVLEHQLDYWRNQLAAAPSLIPLPTDHPRPAIQSSNGATYKFVIPPYTTEGLRELSQKGQATLFLTLMTAYTILISRYAQQHDICIGFPISGRNTPELEQIMGLFVNNLVIRSDLEENPSVLELLDTLKQTTLDAYDHQDVPFDLIIDALKVPRSLSHTPLLQVSFALQPFSVNERTAQLLGRPAEMVDIDWVTAKYDLNLTCFEDGNKISAEMEYNTDLFEETTIKRMMMHFQSLLDGMIVSPDCPVRNLPMLANAERQQLLVHWNSAAQFESDVFAIHHRFEEKAARFPDAIAVRCEEQQISYQALNQRSNQLARELQSRGVQLGDFVGLSLERSVDLLVGLFGIIKAGGAYVPLDPHFPDERLSFILEDSAASVLITSTDLENALADYQGERILIDRDWQQVSQHADTDLDIDVPLDSTLYVLYTSGTTGKPKGCLVTHANVARLFSATDAEFSFDENDIWTLFHSYAFDFTVWEIWGALLYGGKLVVVPYYVSRSPDEFYQLLIKEQVTSLSQTPSAFSQLIAVDAQQEDSDQLSLRTVVFGGEALDFNALKTWVNRHGFDKPELINMYGITETTVHVTYYRVTEQDLQAGRSIIGRPIKDLQVHILDSQGQLLPVGVPGEMYISGPGVTKGYLDRDELTEEKFIDNPFIAELPGTQRQTHQCLYRSGDLARYMPNGDIEYLGRTDLQVKIRGHRIELGEIEAALAKLDAVREALVDLHTFKIGDAEDKQLVAYLLLHEGELHEGELHEGELHEGVPEGEQLPEGPKGEGEADITSIRSKLKADLPEYMIPASFTVLAEWPLTPTGKIDKNALPEPQIGMQSTAEYVEPRNDTEVQLADIWAEVLGVEKVGIYDNFFEVGGHSLMATQVMSRITDHMHVELPLRVIFESPTIAELALNLLEAELADIDMEDDDMEALLAELLDEEEGDE